MTSTTYRIIGTATGPLWWPIGVQAGKPVDATFRKDRGRFVPLDAASSASDAVDVLLARADGDWSGPGYLTADTFLVITRTTGTRSRSRTVDLLDLPSMAGRITPDWYGSDFGSGED